MRPCVDVIGEWVTQLGLSDARSIVSLLHSKHRLDLIHMYILHLTGCTSPS